MLHFIRQLSRNWLSSSSSLHFLVKRASANARTTADGSSPDESSIWSEKSVKNSFIAFFKNSSSSKKEETGRLDASISYLSDVNADVAGKKTIFIPRIRQMELFKRARLEVDIEGKISSSAQSINDNSVARKGIKCCTRRMGNIWLISSPEIRFRTLWLHRVPHTLALIIKISYD